MKIKYKKSPAVKAAGDLFQLRRAIRYPYKEGDISVQGDSLWNTIWT